jgi:hypothetical protein
MSLMDQLRAMEQQVEERLRELAPLVAEYRDLEKVAERLGLTRDAPEASATPAAKPAARAKIESKPKPSGSRARSAQATKSRAPKRKAKAAASKSAPAGTTADAASAPRRSRTAASQRAKPKAKPAAASRGGAAVAGGTTTRAGRNAAAPGQRQQDVLRLVNERPGITVAELAQELSVDATGLYGVVRRLQAKGQISKDGTALRPIQATPTPERTPPTEPPAAAPSTTPDAPTPPPEPPTASS